MAKKRKDSKPVKRSKRAKASKRRGGSKKPRVSKKTEVLKKGKVVKTEQEFQELRGLAAKSKNEGVAIVACWFSDSGGTDKCIELPEDVCKNRGGTPDDPPCPNC
jgi:hypothetical protein